jgi:hypothetical protein
MAVISPTVGLERYAALSNVQMALYHVEDPKYWEFYRQRVKNGDLVFLDCGAYEGVEFNVENYIDRIVDLCPSVVVLPDILLGDWKRSFAYSLGMLEYITRRIDTPFEFMFVPQAKEGDSQGFVTSMLNALDEGFNWIGLPRACNTHIFKLRVARIAQAEFLKKCHPKVKVHALGYGGWLGELELLEQEGVYSWDSGAPVWRGWRGYNMHNQWIDSPLDFNVSELPVNSIGDLVILSNLEACHVDTSKVRGQNKLQGQGLGSGESDTIE